MIISHEQVETMAFLNQIELSAEEKEQYTAQLNVILKYARILEQLDTSQVAPMVHVLPLFNVWREDEVGVGLDREQALQNAPESEEGYFKVPRIL